MANIKIDWLTDSRDCETCGTSYAEGARVTIDGEVALDLAPHANCTEPTHWDQSDVWKMLLEKLGHTVEAGH